jgi:hypothetical protein
MIQPSSIFQFSAEDVEKLILRDRELNLVAKVIQAFEYVLPRLAPASPGPFSEDHEVECGRYMWSRYLIDEVDMLIRRYAGHITLYTRFMLNMKVYDIENIPIYKAYTLDVEPIVEAIMGDEYDELTPEVFHYLNTIRGDLIQGIKSRDRHVKLNKGYVPSAFTLVEEKHSFIGRTELAHIDKTLFVCEELFIAYFHLLLKHTRILDKFKVGQRIPFTTAVYEVIAVYDDGVELLSLRNGTTERVCLGSLLRYYLDELPPEWLESI